MVSTSIRMSLVIDNGNGIYNRRLNFNSSKPSITGVSVPSVNKQPVRRLRMDLHTPMIGRIANAPAGCGSCGGGGF